MGDRRLQTLKSGGQTQNGLHQRHEWEIEVTSDTPDLKQWPKSMAIKGLSRKSLQQQLIPVFTTEFKRSTWNLQWDNETLIEIALDQGQIRTEKNTQFTVISEIELELKSGSPSALYQVALALQMDIPLTLENRSKAERGYALHHPPEITAHKAGQVLLNEADNAETAFMTICWHCLSQLQANEAAICTHNDPEGIHQMRVALRRLRSCLTLFRDLIPKPSQAVFYDDLKWITEQLGSVRDWDVFYSDDCVIYLHN
jgi:triphosphatase